MVSRAITIAFWLLFLAHQANAFINLGEAKENICCIDKTNTTCNETSEECQNPPPCCENSMDNYNATDWKEKGQCPTEKLVEQCKKQYCCVFLTCETDEEIDKCPSKTQPSCCSEHEGSCDKNELKYC